MILQFKNCYILPQPRKPAVPLAFPFFHYIYSESTVSRLSDPLPHYKQQKPVTHSTHAIRLSFLDKALPTFSPNLFSSCSASAFCLPLSERRLFRFNPVVFLVALRVKIVLSHTPVSLLITFDFAFYIIVFFLCTCQVVTLLKCSVFFRHDLRSNVMFAQSFLRFFISASRQQIISFPHAFYPLILFFRRFIFVLFPTYALGGITALSSTFFRSLKKPRISSFQRDSKAVFHLSGSSSSMFCPNFSGTSIKPIL